MNQKWYRHLAVAIVFLMLASVGITGITAQDGATYDEAWLRSIGTATNLVDQFNAAWNSRTGDQWRSNGGTGTFDVPAHSAVLGIPGMQTGNNPAFEPVGPSLYFTEEGGRFGASQSFRAFQLDGAPVAQATNRPNSIDQMLAAIAVEPEYGRKIAMLDIEWTGSPLVINRWGSSGPLELLTADQVTTLGRDQLTELVQLLPGNTIVWGELSDRGLHWGLVRISENVYATTCQGGEFHSLRGFRAMQFAPAAPEAVLSDTEGCAGKYPVLDPNNIVSVQPLATN